MDFAWSETQAILYETALTFAREHLDRIPERGARDPGILDPDVSSAGQPCFPRDAWARCGEFGLLGLSVPSACGGMGLDALTTAHVLEAFGLGCGDTGLLFGVAAHLFACVMPIAEHATPAFKARVVPELCSGRWVGANAITEAGAGSDVFALAATAVRDGDDYVLEGTKVYVTNGPAADVFVVYASTNRAHGYMGVSAFAITRDTPGLKVGQAWDKIGLSSAPLGTLYLEQCRIPATQLLSGEGQGALVFRASMAWERACLFAIYLGSMERQIEGAVAYAKQRIQGGRPIGKYQAISHRIADMKLRLEAARLLLYRACWTLDRGSDPTLEVALSKLAVSEAAVQCGLDAIRIHGGAGVLGEVGVERGLRDAIPATIFSGTSDIQRNLVAARLGL